MVGEPVVAPDAGQAGVDNAAIPPAPALSDSGFTVPAFPAIGELQLLDEQPTLTITPIEYLHPSKTNWMVQAVIKQKSELKTWFNRHLCAERKLFTMILSDGSGDIKANVMNENAEDIYSSLEEGKVYRIENPKIIMAKKKFSGLVHDWEILFGKETRVVGPILPDS
ncbi:hypothetical protein EST38_g2740 [Candolleomyces aberdarensis]|uniref:Replication protein A 70 kDa DNA-binding subunit B/D first OB fold domain-containing protein n=1 Tax=Candolleomyces aberdarensis TaxID=2316362 RepID=A0A4Q2DVZ8_9AGAR|nr:hypothetical protein EST38_g2740 [Candolleomyces aberdarensis]